MCSRRPHSTPLHSTPLTLTLHSHSTSLHSTPLQAIERCTAGRTTLIVAHRLSTVRGAEQICVVGEGRVLDRGAHDELMEGSEVYQALVKRQVGEFYEETLVKREFEFYCECYDSAVTEPFNGLPEQWLRVTEEMMAWARHMDRIAKWMDSNEAAYPPPHLRRRR